MNLHSGNDFGFHRVKSHYKIKKNGMHEITITLATNDEKKLVITQPNSNHGIFLFAETNLLLFAD
jgi:hypothetical protein